MNRYERPQKNWNAIYGIPYEDAYALATVSANRAVVALEWATLVVGRDERWNEFVIALTKEETFLCGSSQPIDSGRRLPGQVDWAYPTRSLQEELFAGKIPPIGVCYGGFTITYAPDRQRKNFAMVTMPGGDLSVVFRNPACQLTRAWQPAVAESMPMPHLAPLGVQPIGSELDFESTGDADRDSLIRALGQEALK
jgi:hypothetical protein